MKNSWQILTLLLAVAITALSIKIATQENSVPVVDTTQTVIDAIMTRSSVRKYTEQKIESDKIDKMLKAGMAAPSAANRQPWELIVVNDKAILDQIPPIIAGAHMASSAPMAIVVAGSPKVGAQPEYWVQDCSAVTENILLAAHAMGLGAVWCGAYPNNAKDRVGELRKLFNLPDDITVLSIIVVGYPAGEPVIKDKWKPEKVHYNQYR